MSLLKLKSYTDRSLQAFPKNKRAQEGLAALEKSKQYNVKLTPSQDTIKKLINLYNQGQFTVTVEQAQVLTNQYPEGFIIWNILGASRFSNRNVGQSNKCLQKMHHTQT